jgi:hypothetical protein
VAFPFQDNFLVGTIHGTNIRPASNPTAISASEIVEIQDYEDDISVLTTKTSSGLQSEVVVGNWAASGSNPVSNPTADLTHPEPDGTSPTTCRV